MKNLILSFIAVVLMCNFAAAQQSTQNSTNRSNSEDTRGKFQFGLKAGGNFANVYDASGEEFRADPKLGFVGGLFLNIPMGRAIGFHPEILYSQKGFKAEGRLLGTNYGLTRTSTFIDVPLFLAIKPSSVVTFLVGPQFSYLIKRKDTFNSALGTVEQIQEFENDNIRKNILGAVAGIDVNVGPVVFGARAGWDLMTNNGDGTSQTPRYKNAWIQATIGYRFL